MNEAPTFRLFAAEESATYAPGETIFSLGDAGDSMFAVQEGEVDLIVSGQVVETVRPGGIFGEMALIDSAPRSADAKVHERVRLLTLPKDAFEDLLFLHKDLAYEVLWSFVRMLTVRLRETNDKLTFLSVTGKFE